MSALPTPTTAHVRRQRVHGAVRELMAEQGFRVSMEAVAAHFRNVTLGVALETVAAVVTDLTPAPTQLSLIEEKP